MLMVLFGAVGCSGSEMPNASEVAVSKVSTTTVAAMVATVPVGTVANETGSVEISVAADGTIPPTPLFGLFDGEQTYAADTDLVAAVAALRASYPEVGDVPIAIPSAPPPGSTVRFVGMMSWDGVPDVVTIVGSDQPAAFTGFTVGATADAHVACVGKGAGWVAHPWRSDPDGCADREADGSIAAAEWTEQASGWRLVAGSATVDIDATIADLRILQGP